MADTFEFTLNSPLTEEQWDMINDVDFDHTDSITFHTKHGKEVEFAKVIRCRDCTFLRFTGTVWKCQNRLVMMLCEPDDYCSRAERRNNVTVD